MRARIPFIHRGKHGVEFKAYWVDEKEGKVYCLSEGANAESVTNTHKEAHGLMPAKIMEVAAVILPLVGAIIAGLGGRWIGKTAAKVIKQSVAENKTIREIVLSRTYQQSSDYRADAETARTNSGFTRSAALRFGGSSKPAL